MRGVANPRSSVPSIEATVARILLLLVVIVAVGIATQRERVPYTVGLVVAGTGLGLLSRDLQVGLTPEIVLLVFLPALLFAAAWEISLPMLRRYWLAIALLATAGVGIGIAVSFAALAFGAHVPPATALAFGALVCATDPVAVIAIFNSLGVDAGLTTIVDGESLFNDAVAVVAYKVLVLGSVATLTPQLALGTFASNSIGGVVVGVTCGIAGTLVLRLIREYALEATATTIVAYGSYLAADALHVSGILAVITSGICLPRLSARFSALGGRSEVTGLWEFAAFAANSLLFLLVGSRIDVAVFAPSAIVAWAIASVIVGRAIMVYALAPLAARFGPPIPLPWRHVMFVGGLRGALSMALVLSLPHGYPDRTLLVQVVFAVVFFTIVAQGLVLRPLVDRLGLARGVNAESARA